MSSVASTSLIIILNHNILILLNFMTLANPIENPYNHYSPSFLLKYNNARYNLPKYRIIKTFVSCPDYLYSHSNPYNLHNLSNVVHTTLITLTAFSKA
jgi:hypothetical protein